MVGNSIIGRRGVYQDVRFRVVEICLWDTMSCQSWYSGRGFRDSLTYLTIDHCILCILKCAVHIVVHIRAGATCGACGVIGAVVTSVVIGVDGAVGRKARVISGGGFHDAAVYKIRPAGGWRLVNYRLVGERAASRLETISTMGGLQREFVVERGKRREEKWESAARSTFFCTSFRVGVWRCKQ